MHRAVRLKEAVDYLELPYTYDIIKVDSEKRKSRMFLGQAAAQILSEMAMRMIDASVESYIRARNLERQENGVAQETQQTQEEGSQARQNVIDSDRNREASSINNEAHNGIAQGI
jgi:hypothetical protein